MERSSPQKPRTYAQRHEALKFHASFAPTPRRRSRPGKLDSLAELLAPCVRHPVYQDSTGTVVFTEGWAE